MNLYLLLAIAFGAITGAAEAPVVRASVILSRADGEGSRLRKSVATEILRCAQDDGCNRRHEAAIPRQTHTRLDAPLTGAATPRAPATIG